MLFERLIIMEGKEERQKWHEITKQDVVNYQNYKKQKGQELDFTLKDQSEDHIILFNFFRETFAEASKAEKDFIKKYVITGLTNGHTAAVIYGSYNKKPFFVIPDLDSFLASCVQELKNNDVDVFTVMLQGDRLNCGVFAIELCKHINMENIKTFIENKTKFQPGRFCKNFSLVSASYLPNGLLKYNQNKDYNEISKQINEDKLNNLLKKIKPENFSTDKYGTEILPLNTAPTEIINNSDKYFNKAASKKNKKIHSLDYKRNNDNEIV